jgi:peroxiredoxin
MKRKLTKQYSLILMIMVVVSTGPALSQTTEMGPVSLEEPMPDFTLPTHQGGEVTLSRLEGKNVLLIFPRGRSREGSWCHVCNYQYAELVELEQREQIREKYNMEVLFVLPYSREMVKEWVEVFPEQLADIENWKKPADPANLDATAKQRLDRATKHFPTNYVYEKGKVPTPFPILIDAERTVTKGLGIFTEEWGGRKVDQNIPTVLILNEDGTVQFKYMSQNTLDRPSADYLLRFLETMSK